MLRQRKYRRVNSTFFDLILDETLNGESHQDIETHLDFNNSVLEKIEPVVQHETMVAQDLPANFLDISGEISDIDKHLSAWFPVDSSDLVDSLEESEEFFEVDDLYISADALDSGIESLERNLYDWKMRCNVSKNALTDLLNILQPVIPDLPGCAGTLKSHVIGKEAANSIIEQENGEFVWFGIEDNLKVIVQQGLCEPTFKSHAYSVLEREALVQNKTLLTVQISVDGIPLFKSSGKALWPILIHVNESILSRTFVAGAFYGTSKPSNIKDFLCKAVTELSYLTHNGLTIGDRHFPFKIMAFICDSPARSFIKGMKYCTGYHCCDFCTIKGERGSGKVIFLESNCTERTDQSFQLQVDSKHHNYESPLTGIPGLGLVTQFPPEPMHCCYLGVCKRFLTAWIEEYLRPSERKRLSNEIEALGRQLPVEFKRKVRSLSCLKFWKATEFRNFVLYIFPNISRNFFPLSMYNHFLLLHFSLYTLSRKNFQKLYIEAEACLRKFVHEVPKFYGEDHMIYNVHILLHLPKFVLKLGPLEFWSAFRFESFLYYIKQRIHRPTGVLTQLRALNYQGVAQLSKRKTVTVTDSHPNCFAWTDMGLVSATAVENGIVIGYACVIVKNLYETPYPSSVHNIGIYHVTDKIVKGTIKKKCAAFRGEDSRTFTVIPLVSQYCYY
jgi:hypothetical protein